MRVLRFEPGKHLDETVAVLQRVGEVDPGYPPHRATGRSPEALEHWLKEEGELLRFAAVVDGVVAGHILVADAHAYLLEHLSKTEYQHMGAGVVEIGKFFVDPTKQRMGIGSALLKAALDGAWFAGRQPALAVLAPSDAARRLYAASGMREVGTFTGKDGLNHVFVDEQGPQTFIQGKPVYDGPSARTR